MFSIQSIYRSTGVARGCGWQHVVTVINLGTFYLIGMPIAAFCGFKLKLYAKVLSYEIGNSEKIMFFICDVVSLFTVLVKTGFVDWFDMPAPTMTPELKRDLQLLKVMCSSLLLMLFSWFWFHNSNLISFGS